MLRNWHFDILNLDHWQIAWDLWSDSWVISEPKEWAFVLIIISFIPLWFTGWIALSMVSWGKAIWFVITLPWKLFKNFFYKPVKIITTNTGVTPIRRKRSYKEIRPRALGNTPTYSDQIEISPRAQTNVPVIAPIVPAAKPASSAADKNAKFEHTLFKFDDTEDIDFDIDAFDVTPTPKPQPRNERRRERDDYYDEEESRDSRRRNNERKAPRDSEKSERRRNERPAAEVAPKRASERPAKDEAVKERQAPQRQVSGSCADVIRQKGYEVISRVTVKNTVIDYVGVSADTICLCMLDREAGDWLADEERFNDEEPLWFSENSHRISPVRKIELAQKAISDRLSAANLNFNIIPFVIIQIGNIINAEDMFEIWDSMNINVTRIDRGTPKEIKLFARTLPDADKPIAPGKLDKLLNLLRNTD